TNARTTGRLNIGGGSDIYRLSAVNTNTSITLVEKFVQPDISAAAYNYWEDEYALATDFLRPIDYRLFSDALPITLIGRNEWRQRYPRPNVSGRPKVATLIDAG